MRRRPWESRDEHSRVRRADPSLLLRTAKVSGREPADSWGRRAACCVLEKPARLEPNQIKMGIVGKCILHSGMN